MVVWLYSRDWIRDYFRDGRTLAELLEDLENGLDPFRPCPLGHRLACGQNFHSSNIEVLEPGVRILIIDLSGGSPSSHRGLGHFSCHWHTTEYVLLSASFSSGFDKSIVNC